MLLLLLTTTTTTTTAADAVAAAATAADAACSNSTSSSSSSSSSSLRIRIYLLAHRNLLWDIIMFQISFRAASRPICHSHAMTNMGR